MNVFLVRLTRAEYMHSAKKRKREREREPSNCYQWYITAYYS